MIIRENEKIPKKKKKNKWVDNIIFFKRVIYER